jgi:hypothetical protein
MARMHGYTFTINNYTPEIVLKVQGSVGIAGIKFVCYGFEIGEQGTRHMQGYVQVNHDKKDRIQKAFGVKCHLEKQKADSGPSELEMQGTFGKPFTAIGYCMKDGDFHEYGDKTEIKGTSQGSRTDHAEVKELIASGKTYQEIVDTNFGYAAKYGKFIKEQVAVQRMAAGKSSLLVEYEGVSWKPWQQAVLDVINTTPDRRKIHWYWEPVGNVGKSWLAKYVLLQGDALLLESGKKVDMAYIFAQNPTKTVMIDLSRTSAPVDGKDYLAGMYSICENLKNGVLMSTKYESMSVQFAVPHVIVFANWEPDYTKWSADRYDVTNLSELSFAPP